jgi:hypothetical protein
MDFSTEILFGLLGQRLIIWMILLLILKINVKAQHPIIGILAIIQYGVYVEPSEFITLGTTIGFFLPELLRLIRFPAPKKSFKS